MKWILASQSPRRRELLGQIIQEFDVIPAKGEEDTRGETSPERVVVTLAAQKAAEVAALDAAQGKAVLGSDTVVAFHGEILGKPKDEQDAVRMLKLLSGNTHEVFTGVCIIYPKGDGAVTHLAADCTKVTFERLTDEQIAAYVESGSPMDKAGAYGIQDGGLVHCIEGSFSNVVGLPIELVKEMIEEIERDK
jgi:septum formation protein